MVISSITFKNFKSFKGEHQLVNLDSVLSPNQNIILFGGLNGAGKTTFLEALFLCFYGKLATKHYPSEGAKLENYEAFICGLLNNSTKRESTLEEEMFINLLLNDVPISGPVTRNIELKRTWSFNQRGGKWRLKDETFEILENGEPIEEIEPSYYQDAILGLLPYNVSPFFFFDGEKIQEFAADADKEFADSLKDVLGITLYSYLLKDLKTVRGKILSQYNRNKEAKVRLQERKLEQERLEQEVEEQDEEIARLNDEISALSIEREIIDQETFRVTLIDPSNRENLDFEKNEKEKEKEVLEREFIETSKDFLPFLLASEFSDEIIAQLREEEKLFQWQAIQEKIEPQISAFIENVFKDQPREVELQPRQRRYFEMKIDESIRLFFLDQEESKVKDVTPIHFFSKNDSQSVIEFFQTLDQGVVKTLASKADRLKQINIALDKIGRTKARAGDTNEEIQKLLDRKSLIDIEIGQKYQRIEDLKIQLDNNERNIEICQREITNWEQKAKLSKKEKQQIEYCESMTNAIIDFQREFQAKRTQDLEESILEMWNSLSHKDQLVKKVQVLPESNFEVKLFDGKNSEIDKTKLSAGEKEVYAISLLWALVKASGKRLPIVIDTPFGRLDSIHRKNLVTQYFPKASHQVILLSQDEEIVGEYYRLLQPCIARELSIENDEVTSSFSEGYPFKNNEYAAVREER